MLPAFPKIEAFRGKANHRIIKRLAAGLSPILGQIDRHIQFEGGPTTIVRHDDTIGHSTLDAVTAEVKLPIMPLSDFTEKELIRQLTKLAEQLARGVSANFYASMEREVENVIDAGGKPLSEELILRTLEVMDHSFEPDGTWNPPTIFASPGSIQNLLKTTSTGQKDLSKFEQALNAIVEKKRNDFRLREADRVLAG